MTKGLGRIGPWVPLDDEGGETACWAHLVDDETGSVPTRTPSPGAEETATRPDLASSSGHGLPSLDANARDLIELM
jgi:hypothetical protein